MAEKKKKNRLTDVVCSEVAIVDRGAIGVPFMLYKRDEEGGKETMTLEELQKALDKANADLAEVNKKLEDQGKELAAAKAELEKAKQPPAKVKKADMAEDAFSVELQKMVDEIKEFDEEIAKVGRIFNSKNEAAIQSAYEALGKLLEAAKKRKGDGKDDVTKTLEEYQAATPEGKKDMEQKLVDAAKKMGMDVTPYM